MAPEPSEDETYALTEDAPPAAAPAAAQTVVPRPLAYRAPRADLSPTADTDAIKDLYMPLWVLGGGVTIEVVAALIRGPMPAAMFHVGANLLVGTAIMLAGILLAAKWRGIDLGSFWTAVFKLAAISVGPSAAVTLFTPALRLMPLGLLLGWAAEFVLYFALLGALFDLDQSDTWFCVLVIFLVRLAVYFALFAYVLSRA